MVMCPIEVLAKDQAFEVRKKANEGLQKIFYSSSKKKDNFQPTKTKTILNIFCKQILLQKQLLVRQYLVLLGC